MPITLPSADVSTEARKAKFAAATRKALADLDQGIGGSGTDFQPQINALNAQIAALTARVTAAEGVNTTQTTNIATHETRIDAIEGQSKNVTSLTEPAHDGSQNDGDTWTVRQP